MNTSTFTVNEKKNEHGHDHNDFTNFSTSLSKMFDAFPSRGEKKKTGV